MKMTRTIESNWRRLALAAVFLFAAAPATLAVDYTLLVANVDGGEVRAVLQTEVEALSLARDAMATLTLTAPTGIGATLPSPDALRERFQGFSIAEGYALEPEEKDETTRQTIRWRLRADPAAERYRLAPFAVETGITGHPGFATAPVMFPMASLPPGDGGIEIAPRKFFLMPTMKDVCRWMLCIVIAAAIVALAVFLVRRIRHAVKIRMMSPSERALHELAQLLGRHLVEKGLIKDYYIELTHVVRRYIERAYGIRAPRQTTDEFLASARIDERFAQASLAELSDFLRSSDLIKFAGVAATGEMADAAAYSARRYIKADAGRKAQEEEAAR